MPIRVLCSQDCSCTTILAMVSHQLGTVCREYGGRKGVAAGAVS